MWREDQYAEPDHLLEWRNGVSTDINALARDIAERQTGMPAYAVDDETWDAALAEAEATYQRPGPKSSLQEAISRARYLDPVEFINAYNESRNRNAI